MGITDKKKKVIKITAGICVAIAVVTGAVSIVMFRYGFSSYGIKEHRIDQKRKYRTWNEVFNVSVPMRVKILHSGDAIAAPGSRPYLSLKKLPADYRIDQEEISPICAFAVTGHSKGDILIDTGLNNSFADKPPYGDLPLMLSVYQRVTKTSYRLDEDADIGQLLVKSGIKPVIVLLTHLHPDHICGLTEIDGSVPVMFGARENTFYYRALAGRYFGGKQDIRTIDFREGHDIPPFGRVVDLLGDASVWAISSPGHTPDHISYLINARGTPVLIIGDLSVSESFLRSGIESASDYGDAGAADITGSLAELREFRRNFPNVELLFSHSDK